MSGHRVLLVEDDPQIRAVLGLYLQRLGFRVTEASDGEAGVAQFRSGGADVILLDVLLPKLDGIGVLRALRGDAAGKHVPVIVMSAVFGSNVAKWADGENLNVFAFVAKPFQLRQVQEVVERALGITPPPSRTTAAVAAPVLDRRIEHVREPVPAQGDLARRPLAELLYALAREGASGRLRIRSGHTIKDVVLRAGVPVYAASTLPEETLGQHLVRVGVLSAERLDALRTRTSERGVKLGEVLLEERVLDSHGLYEHIRDHMADKIVRAFAWTEGRFDFTAGDAGTERGAALRMDVPTLLLTGIAQHMTAAAVARRLGIGAAARPFLRAGPPHPAEELPLGPLQRRLLRLARLGATLDEIGARVHKDHEALLVDFYALFVLELVGFEDRSAGGRPSRAV